MAATPHTKRITLHDVARAAGVSYQTVSRVINEHPHVSSATRQRVLEAVKVLNYQPNIAARSLVTRRSRMLELIVYGSSHYGPSQMVANVERAARELGYNLMLANITAVTVEEIQASINSLSGRFVDGIILIAPVRGVSYEQIRAICGDLPFVMIDTQPGIATPSVVIDQHYGSQLVTQHLIDLGHRRICEISGPLDWYGAAARHESWQDTLRAAGLQPGPSVAGDWTAAGGYAAALDLLEGGAAFTALVAGNDQMAFGAVRALRDRNLRVPEDVSVVGFDDVPETAYFEPPLTTVRQDFDALGRQSADYLVSLIERPNTPLHQRVLYPQLVVRRSTLPPAR
jgi:LacI family transcriptional regulator